ncbi:hypothetical protein GQ42DRAFT_119730 [Ramicandelaber brevisporus]|nr:hypothetical protein GQ42DRAFT_119730 [Ramicandelaber brevisporus]
MESHNDGQLDVLAGKVTSLRQVTIDIHDNVNRQNQDLDEVDDRFGTLGTSLTSARRRFAQVFFPGDNAQGFDSISTCRLVLYIVGGFFSIVLLVKLIGFVAHLRTPVPVTPPPSTPN